MPFLEDVGEWSFRDCEVSPDGKWILVRDGGGTHLMNLNGSDERVFEDKGRGEWVAWLERQ